MKTKCRTKGDCTYFIITDLDKKYYNIVNKLFYQRVEDGFARGFPTSTPNLEKAYQNFEKYIKEVIFQMAGIHQVPWQKSLLAFLKIVKNHNVNWWLTGSAALTVRGINIVPKDFDIVVDDEGAHKLGELLSDYVFEPVVDTGDWFARWFGRAFLHACIEWIGGVTSRADEPVVSDFGPTAARNLETVDWQGYEIRVPPLEYQLRQNRRRGLIDRVKKIKAAMT